MKKTTLLVMVMMLIGLGAAAKQKVGVGDDAQVSIHRPLINVIKHWLNENFKPGYHIFESVLDFVNWINPF